MILAMLFAIVAVALLSALILGMIVYALPLFVGVWFGMFLHSGGTGLLGSIAAGIAGAMATLIIAHWLLAMTKSPLLHGLIGLAFAVPAAFAAYHLVHGIIVSSMPSEAWTLAVSATGAVILGIVAWVRVPNLEKQRAAN